MMGRVRIWLALKLYPGMFAQVDPGHCATTSMGSEPTHCTRCSLPVEQWSSQPCAAYMGRLVKPTYRTKR